MNKENLDKLKECFLLLDDIIPTVDKIGSGFNETEKVSLTLLLFFKSQKILEKLSTVRKVIDENIQLAMNDIEYNNFIEQDTISWEIPYNSTQEELLKMIKDN